MSKLEIMQPTHLLLSVEGDRSELENSVSSGPIAVQFTATIESIFETSEEETTFSCNIMDMKVIDG